MNGGGGGLVIHGRCASLYEIYVATIDKGIKDVEGSQKQSEGPKTGGLGKRREVDGTGSVPRLEVQQLIRFSCSRRRCSELAAKR